MRLSGPDGGTESEPDPRLSTGFPTRFLLLKEDKDFCLKQDNQGYTRTVPLFELGVFFVVFNYICLSFMQIHAHFYINYIIYYGLLIFCCQNVATHLL